MPKHCYKTKCGEFNLLRCCLEAGHIEDHSYVVAHGQEQKTIITYEEWWAWEQRRLKAHPFTASSERVMRDKCATCHKETRASHMCANKEWRTTDDVRTYEQVGLRYQKWTD